MLRMSGNGQTKVKNVAVKSDTFLGSVFSQIVGITVTDTDITLEFVYLNPRPPADRGEVVTRVTMPKRTGEDLARAIVDTIKQHESKKKT